MLVRNHFDLPVGNTDTPVLVTHPRGGIPSVIDTPQALDEAARQLEGGHTPIALDVERAQGFRFSNDPYLIQIRREDVGTFLIDTHALPDLRRLSAGCRDVWLLHDAEQDLPNLRQVGLDTNQLFDTEIGARLLGLTHFGLAAVCEQILGLTLVKDHQASDWSIRPLHEDWLRYAALDVEMLTELYRHMGQQLDQLGRWEWVQQECAEKLSHLPPAPKKDRWRHLPGASRLNSRRALAVLQALWQTRQDLAQELDLAPGRLVRNSALVHAAAIPPRNRRSLLAIGEFRSPIARQYADRWLKAIRHGLTMDEKQLPLLKPERDPHQIPNVRQWPRADAEAFARLQVVRHVVATIAEQLNLAPDVVLEPKAQRFLCWAPLDPTITTSKAIEERLQVAHVRPWQQELVIQPLIQALS